VERERGLVRVDAGALGPEPDDDELLVLLGGEVDQAVDTAADAGDASGPDMVTQELRRVPDLGRLPGGEVAGLTGGRLEETVPSRMRQGVHTRK
jgi:hypothetical protein